MQLNKGIPLALIGPPCVSLVRFRGHVHISVKPSLDLIRAVWVVGLDVPVITAVQRYSRMKCLRGSNILLSSLRLLHITGRF